MRAANFFDLTEGALVEIAARAKEYYDVNLQKTADGKN